MAWLRITQHQWRNGHAQIFEADGVYLPVWNLEPVSSGFTDLDRAKRWLDGYVAARSTEQIRQDALARGKAGRILAKDEVYARGVYQGDRVYLLGKKPRKARQGTLVFDDHGVEARVLWDDGRESIEMHASLRWLQKHEDRHGRQVPWRHE